MASYNSQFLKTAKPYKMFVWRFETETNALAYNAGDQQKQSAVKIQESTTYQDLKIWF